MKTLQKLSGYSMSRTITSGNLPFSAMLPTEHHMYDDAKLRMDDEGGSLNPAAEPTATLGKAPIKTRDRI